MKANHGSIKVIRTLKGYSQTAAAEGCGIERANYAHIEAGRRPGTPEQIVSIAHFLKVGIDVVALMPNERVATDDDIESVLAS